jgi:enterochelin esterase-like enzyme
LRSAGVLLALLVSVSCAAPPATSERTAVAASAIATMQRPESSSAVEPVTRAWNADELLARQAQEGASVWAEGDELTFVYQGQADQVSLCCAIALPMQQLPASDIWALSVHVENLAQALISYAFVPKQPGRLPETNLSFSEWRGAQAPPAPARAEPLRGQIKQYTLPSAALGLERDLTVYLPPDHDPQRATPVIYLADGESTEQFAEVLEPLIAEGALPPMLLVGVHSASDPADPSGAQRTAEYIPNVQPSSFAPHERFFVEEVRQWAERELGAATDRTQRAIFGFSNGAVFAATMGIRHPLLYGHVLAFSLGVPPEQLRGSGQDAPDFYLVAGTLEEGFHSTTSAFAATLERSGVRHEFKDRVAGHDHFMWRDEFPAAVRWAFGKR